jgi:hypothetical protein
MNGGTIKEWVKIAIKGIPNIDKIAEGFINDVRFQFNSLPEDKQEEIVKRRLICATCPFNSFRAKESEEYKQLFGESYKTDRTDLHCSICGCPVSTKTASLAVDCGMEEYNKNNPENQQPLKWIKYE